MESTSFSRRACAIGAVTCAVALAAASVAGANSDAGETILPNELPQAELEQSLDPGALGEMTAASLPAPDAIPGEGDCAGGHDWRATKVIDVPASTTSITVHGLDDEGNTCRKWVLVDSNGYYIETYADKSEAQAAAEAYPLSCSISYVGEYMSSTFYQLDSQPQQHVEYECKVCGERTS